MDDQGRWEAFEPGEMAGLLADFDSPWWIAGGWAIDLFAGRTTREHDDVDIELPRDALVGLATLLDGWEMLFAHSGSLYPWRPTESVPDEMHGLWCRPDPGSPWRFQILLARVDDGVWHYRRDPRVTRQVDEIGFRTADGWPVIAPEIQLLYKAARVRPKDQRDLEIALPLLSGVQREWLKSALETWSPDHEWLVRLAGQTSASNGD